MTANREMPSAGAPRPSAERLRRCLEIAGQILIALVAVAHPALFGWLPPFADGRATMDVSLAEFMLIAPALLLFPLAVAILLLKPAPFSLRKALPFLLGGLFFLFVLLQILPLPDDLHRALSPASRPLMDDSLALASDDPGGPRTLSILPHDTLIALLRFGAALSVFLASFVVIRSRKDLLRVAVPVVGAGALLAFLGMIKALASLQGGTSLAFLFPEGGGGTRASGPFINANQFAGLMEILFPVSIALLAWVLHVARREGESLKATLRRLSGPGARAVLLALASLLMAGAVLVSQSRLGILSFLAGGGVLAVLLTGKSRMRWRAMAAGTLVVLGFFLYLGLQPVLDRYALLVEVDEVDRIRAWKMGAEIAGDFPLTGTGLGTFRRIAPLYQPPDLHGGYFQTHNDYLNMASDVGLPGLALLLGMAAAWIAAVFPGLKRHGRLRPAFTAAVLASFCAVAVHSFGDFNLQVTPIAVHLALIAGLGMAAASLPDVDAGREKDVPVFEKGDPS